MPPLRVETYENQKQAGLHYKLDGQKLLNFMQIAAHSSFHSMLEYHALATVIPPALVHR
jgi:hypothetical protein